MKGKPSQMLVTRLALKAVEKRENQAMGSRLVPKRRLMPRMRPVTAPNWRWDISFHISAVT